MNDRPMCYCFFVSDLHGNVERYRKLWRAIDRERPEVLLMGGDLLPFGSGFGPDARAYDNFIRQFMMIGFNDLKLRLQEHYPLVLLILGNDDPRMYERDVIHGERMGLWCYIHRRRLIFEDYVFFGYAHIPPTPFLLKDWERYDVSRHVDPGCTHPTEGHHTVPLRHNLKFVTIQKELDGSVNFDDFSRTIMLFHTPPYRCVLDRAELDGKRIDHVPLEKHLGSIALRRFIETKQPFITLHGHVHESSRLTGSWKDTIGRTQTFSAAVEPPHLAIVKFYLNNPEEGQREIL